MSERIITQCPKCGTNYNLRPQAAGRRARCKSCNEIFRIPGLVQSMEETVTAWLLEESESETKPTDQPRTTTARDLAGKETANPRLWDYYPVRTRPPQKPQPPPP